MIANIDKMIQKKRLCIKKGKIVNLFDKSKNNRPTDITSTGLSKRIHCLTSKGIFKYGKHFKSIPSQTFQTSPIAHSPSSPLLH